MTESYSEDIVEKILFEPISTGADKLCILSANATPSMVSWLMTTYSERNIENISIELIIESVVDDGIDYVSHEGFKELQKSSISGDSRRFICSYLYQPPAEKKNYFIWLKEKIPVQAFACSYDFTQASFLRGRRGSFTSRIAAYAYKLYENMADRTIYCTHSEVEDYVVIRSSNSSLLDSSERTKNQVFLPLITKKTGEPGKKSGLNWGQRNKRNKNEAYIPLPSKIAKSGFFPLNKQHFLVVTDDHHTLQLRVEQGNDKAITTPASNAQLGEYFRNRLGLANGAYVHTRDLQAYGRTDVSFYKIDEEQYYMDFSPNGSDL